MARIRSIKPDFWTDGKICRLSADAALFFIALWNFADDSGYFTLDSLELALKVGRWRSQEVSKLTSALVRAGLVKTSRGVGVGLVLGWEHQRIDKPRHSKWEGIEITWDDATAFVEPSATIPRKDRIGEDRKGSDRIVAQGSAGPAAPSPPLAETKPKEPTPTALAWQAYKAAYERRYQTAPTWNAKVAGQLKQLIARVPAEEAPSIAQFFVGHNDAFYVKSMHPIGVLLRDAEKLRTEWITGMRMLGSQAREIERRQHGSDTWDEAARILNEKRRQNETQ